MFAAARRIEEEFMGGGRLEGERERGEKVIEGESGVGGRAGAGDMTGHEQEISKGQASGIHDCHLTRCLRYELTWCRVCEGCREGSLHCTALILLDHDGGGE